MLMRPHDGRVDHRVLVVGIVRQGFEKILPNAVRRPTREALVGIAPAAEACRQITPRCADTEFPDHRVNEQAIAKIAITTDRPRTAGKQILDPGELVVPQAMTFHSGASIGKAPHESRLR
jgi:hypothetical protein